MEAYLQNVAVIGAGLGGCAVALALSQRKIPVTVYESRPEDASSLHSGVLLTPNGLYVLDRLGVLPRVRDRCYLPTHRVFKNDNDETTDKTPMDSKDKFGYTNHRIWRQTLLDEMRAMLKELSVEMHFGSKFGGILNETSHGVTFKINESSYQASMLIGSDGLHSAVRKYLAPEVQPWYTGLTGIAGHARFSTIDWPYEGYERNCTLQSKAGAIVWIAEDEKGEDLMFAIQINLPKQSRQDLDDLQADHDRILSFFTEKYDQWGPTARKIIDALRVNKDTLFIWPFMKMPPLPRWYSESKRVLLIGDGAHAIPPSSAQGVNQALEDAYSLALLLDGLQKTSPANDAAPQNSKRWAGALARWQHWRQGKVDDIYEWTRNTTDVGRLPEDERKKLIAEGKVKDPRKGDMAWLFLPDIEGNVEKWVSESACD